jgi:RNA polymerase sigma-70 factor (ECF subfamily)
MSKPPTHDVTVLLRRVSVGDESAPGKLLELAYDDLRRLAGAYMKDERADHTLQATALVHEAYLRLVDWEKPV